MKWTLKSQIIFSILWDDNTPCEILLMLSYMIFTSIYFKAKTYLSVLLMYYVSTTKGCYSHLGQGPFKLGECCIILPQKKKQNASN